MRRTPQFIALALVLAAASACSDSTSARLTAPDEASAGKSSGSSSSMTYTSAGGVTATTYPGNTSGEGNSSCSALNLGPTGTKVDGAYSRSVGGYQFTVSGSDKQYLSFAPIAGTTPTTLIRAVIVKGGPAYNVYVYSAGQTSDAGLTSPLNGGGNIPTISHYVVCYGPGSPATFTKRLIDVMIIDAAGKMVTDPVYKLTGKVVVPAPETRWLEYELAYSLPSGLTGTITENETAVCNTLGAAEVNHGGDGTITCSFNYGGATPAGAMDKLTRIVSWGDIKLTGSVLLPIDLVTGGVFCGKRTLVNTATLTLSNGQTLTAMSSTPVEFTKGTNGTCTRS
jgi:hypothetical protein